MTELERVQKIGRRGSITATKQLSVRLDTLIVELLNKEAKSHRMTTSDYVRILLVDHAMGLHAVNEVKEEVRTIHEYSKYAHAEIQTLKQQIAQLQREVIKLALEKK